MSTNDDSKSLEITPKFCAAIQITRPKSAHIQAGSFVSKSPINQSFKVAKLVLKPVQSKANVAIKNNQPKLLSSVRPALSSEHKISSDVSVIKEVQQHQPRGIELERAKITTAKAEREKSKTLKSPHRQQETPVHSQNHHKSKMDEDARREARQFMKKQREKRKMEVKKDVDKSFVIKQRLEELRKSSKNAVTKKTPSKSPVKPSSPEKDMNYYSLENHQMREIKVLRLKPQPKVEKVTVDQEVIKTTKNLSISPAVVKKPVVSPVKRLITSPKEPPLQPRNHAPPTSQQNKLAPPSSSKENKNPITDDLRLKVPDLKLNLTMKTNTSAMLNKTEFLSSSMMRNNLSNIPYFLQNVHRSSYPHNFIWAVRKKLEAFAQEHEKKQKPSTNLETPQVRRVVSSGKPMKGRKISNNLKPEVNDDDYEEVSETNAKSMEQEMQSEANTISEISSIKTDLAKSKSHSDEKKGGDDDTTISESIFQSLSEDPFVGKKRESVNSEFDRNSFNRQIQRNIVPEILSPNTSAKRINFLSSTKANQEEEVFKVPRVPPPPTQNDLNQPNKVNSAENEKEEEFRKMLLAFNKSLSHVVEVNQLLSSALVSKSSSSVASSKKSSATSKQEYSSTFEKNIDTEEEEEEEDEKKKRQVSETNSSIRTLIEKSGSDATFKPSSETIEDPPIVYQQEQPHELTSSTKSKMTELLSDNNNTLNESHLINLFGLASDAEAATTTLIESNGTLSSTSQAAFVFNKSSSEIKSWERSLIERTRGQIAWLELQKQHFRRRGEVDKVSAMKRQQRAILMRLEKERAEHKRERVEMKGIGDEDLIERAVEQLDLSIDLTGNGSDARDNIERILRQREQKIDHRRRKIEYLTGWQKRLDEEEKRLKKMEADLLCANKLSKHKNSSQDLLNTSLEMVKSIDRSLLVLQNVEVTNEDETVNVSGQKMNKLWHRLTGVQEEKFEREKKFDLSKRDLAKFYEEAKERVLESDLKMLLETSIIAAEKTSPPSKEPSSEVDTMNSIANIETEEEFTGNQPETITASTEENDDELQQFMANQMKVFITSSPPAAIQHPPTQQQQQQIIVNDQTFQVQDEVKLHGGGKASSEEEKIMTNIHDESTSTIDVVEDMDIVDEEDDVKSSPIYTEPIHSIDLSAVDREGSIIPEEVHSRVQVTDMDEESDDDNEAVDKMIEDISFPNVEISMNESAHDLSTITECTEYEQPSSEPISSEIVASSSSSERMNSEIEQRLISINDSLELVDQAFEKVALVQTPSTDATYSTDKDFVTESEKSENLLILSPQMGSSESSSSQITTSTPKVLMPDVMSAEKQN